MAYNQYPYSPNFFGSPYQPSYPQQYAQQYAQQTVQPQMNYPSSSSIVWVGSEQEADAYPIAPNNAVALWDRNAACVYLKQADSSGKPSMKVFDLVERSAERQKAAPAVEYMTKEDAEAIKSDVVSIKSEIKRMQGDLYGIAGKRKSSAKEVTDE